MSNLKPPPPGVKPRSTPPVTRRRKPNTAVGSPQVAKRASVRNSIAGNAALRGSIRMGAGSTVADMEAARRKNTAYEYLCHLEETRKWLQACMKLHAGQKKEDIEDDVHLRETPEQKMLADAMSRRLPGTDDLPPPIDESSNLNTTAEDDDLPPPPPMDGGDDTDAMTNLPPPPPPDEEEEEKDEFELPPAAELEERLRNGVYLVKLAQFMDPNLSDRKMFDVTERIWKNEDDPDEGPKLVFRHTDNILQWIKAMGKMGLPKVFFPEVTDIYDKKNMPKAIYCIHALSQFLYRQGIGPVMENLHGVATFTEEEISQMDAALTDAGVQMPQFGKIGGVLAGEIGADDAAVHAAVLGINQAIEQEVPAEDLHVLLISFIVGLDGVSMDNMYKERYRTDLIAARAQKVSSASTSDDVEGEEADIYDTNLTKTELQQSLDSVNKTIAVELRKAAVLRSLAKVGDAIASDNIEELLAALSNNLLSLSNVDPANIATYLAVLKEMSTGEPVTIEQILEAIAEGNRRVEEAKRIEAERIEAERIEAERVAAIEGCITDVNVAIVGDDQSAVLAAITHELLSLVGIDIDQAAEYHTVFKEVHTGEPMSLVQIQEAINMTNARIEAARIEAERLASVGFAVEEVNTAIDGGDPDVLLTKLHSEALALSKIDDSAIMEYLVQLQALKSACEGALSKDQIQAAVDEANHLIDEQRLADEAVAMLNTLLAGGSPDELMAHMREHAVLLELPPIADESQRYFDRFTEIKMSTTEAMSQSAIQNAITSVNDDIERERIFNEALVAVGVAIAGEDPVATVASMRHESLGLSDIQDNIESPFYTQACAERYHTALKAVVSEESPTITKEQIQAVVTSTNTTMADEQQHAEALGLVNTLISNDEVDVDAILNGLSDPVLNLSNIDEAGAEQYHTNMKAVLASTGASLVVTQLQEQIDHTNFVAEENAKHTAVLFRINAALQNDDDQSTLALLSDKYSRLTGVADKCALRYHQGMGKSSKAKNSDEKLSLWKVVNDDEGRPYYYNKETKETLWEPPADLESQLLTLADLQKDVVGANDGQATQEFYEANQDKIVVVQAHVRGALQSKRFKDRKAFIEGQSPHIVKIQAMVKMIIQRRRYRERLAFLNAQTEATLRIQAGWKGVKVRRNYKGLTKVVNPPVNTVRRFLHLLDQSHLDFAEELQVGKYKESVVLEIKDNTRLEAAITDMDIKIALLVKNRIELQDVVKTSKQMYRKQRKGEAMNLPGTNNAGLKSLDSKSRALLLSYSHLFYLLQTDPKYLATMVFVDHPMQKRLWTELKVRKFLDRIIQTTYNYGSSSREKYLSLKLYQTAQRKEIMEKASALADMMKEEVTVVRLYINHYRQNGSDDYFKESVRKPVLDLLLCTDLDFTIEPEVVYKRLAHKREAETGEKHEAGYDVNREEAMKDPQVRKQIEANINQLLAFASKMLSAIVKNVSKIPFGLRFLGKCIYDNLKEKFPKATEDDLLKVVGNMLFYRYLNPVIVQPESYLLKPDDGVTEVDSMKRKSLGQIVKLLQMAGTNQNYNNSPIYSDINSFLSNAALQFNKYYVEAINVETAEIHFNIDEYSDVTMLTKPTIFITPADIRHLHIMLLDNLESVAPDLEDPIRTILSDLGEAPQMDLEETEGESNDSYEMSLTLANKFEVKGDEDLSIKALFVRTKRLVVDIIRFQQGKSLKIILDMTASREEEDAHNTFVLERQAKEAANKDIGRNLSEDHKKNSFKRLSKEGGAILTLQEIKSQVYDNIGRLEEVGLCSKKDSYQGLLNAVAQDIRNQRIYRRQRKQELAKLKSTLDELGVKKKHMDEQIEFYESYVQNAIGAITKKKGIKKSAWPSLKKKAEEDEEGRHMGKYRYSAQKLLDKGVLVDVAGYDSAKLKQVILEINRQSEKIFVFSAKFIGIQMDNETVDFEELLKLQYDNVTTTKMFEYCTVNVNLLIFLLNKKYYSK